MRRLSSCRCTGVTAGVSASLKVQCAMTSFLRHILLDQCNNFSEFFSLFFHTFNEALFIVVHFILFF